MLPIIDMAKVHTVERQIMAILPGYLTYFFDNTDGGVALILEDGDVFAGDYPEGSEIRDLIIELGKLLRRL